MPFWFAWVTNKTNYIPQSRYLSTDDFQLTEYMSLFERTLLNLSIRKKVKGELFKFNSSVPLITQVI